MQKITILITGVSGLVGHGMSCYFLSKGYKVIGTSRKKISSWHPNLKIANLSFSEPNITNKLRKIINNVDWVVHSAANIKRGQMSIKQGINLFRANTTILYDLLKILTEFPNKKFIFISSARPFRKLDDTTNKLTNLNNFDEYLTSKVMAEIICNQFILTKKVEPIILRISAPYGYILNNSVLSNFINKVRLGQNITIWGSGKREQIFTFVEDIGLACEKACQNNAIVELFFITGTEAVTMKQLAKAIIQVFPESGSKIVYESRIDPEEGIRVHYPLEKAREEFNYSPYHTIHQGLKKISEFLINNDL